MEATRISRFVLTCVVAVVLAGLGSLLFRRMWTADAPRTTSAALEPAHEREPSRLPDRAHGLERSLPTEPAQHARGADRAPDAPPSGDEAARHELGALPDFVETPEPGIYEGPLAVESFASGAPLFEAQQIQREDGVWILDGQWTSWHENGVVQESGTYRAHREHGPWQWWDENGQPIARGSFVDGEREGAWTFWYEDGTKQMDAFYTAGKGEGEWLLYHENGLKCAAGSFVAGEISGYWTIWDEAGAIDRERTGLYEGGKKVGD